MIPDPVELVITHHHHTVGRSQMQTWATASAVLNHELMTHTSPLTHLSIYKLKFLYLRASFIVLDCHFISTQNKFIDVSYNYFLIGYFFTVRSILWVLEMVLFFSQKRCWFGRTSVVAFLVGTEQPQWLLQS